MDIPEATACPFVSLTISIVTLPEPLPAIICASATHNTSQGCRAIKNGKLAGANTLVDEYDLLLKSILIV